ncbi:MAG: 1-deoxy-D-xylulose-5-phosphate reductoisomerase [Candidatus Omnitrophica bacterium]|nr:1-deoxy-D-xylulose-5-phosphate reductoisomerase [Candidatus Omnitrophota bacterium]
MRKVVVLGSTGSVGKNALNIIQRYPDKFKVVGLSANTNYKMLIKQAKEFSVKDIAVFDETKVSCALQLCPSSITIRQGMKGVLELAVLKEADIVVIAISGTTSILPLIEAIKAKKQIAVASKEAFVSAGRIVKEMAKKHNVKVLPVDSEHSAIFQCLNGEDHKQIRNIYITGTGGPLRNVERKDFHKLNVKRVTDHPKWNMGKKITVDSATLMNKGLEVIEAKWLFDVPIEKIKVVLQPEAIIHSMVEFQDGTVMANMSEPDMKFPLLYALSYPERLKSSLPRLDFTKLNKLNFKMPDKQKFPALDLCYKVSSCESSCAVLNAANEQAVLAFLDEKIRFLDIIDIVKKVLKKHKPIPKPSLEQILEMDEWAKGEVDKIVNRIS